MNDLMTKSFMSYVELKKAAAKDLEAGGGGEEEACPCPAGTAADGNLRRFYEEAGRVKDEMEEIRLILVRLEEANEEGKALHKPESIKALRSRINGDVTKVLKKARSIKNLLDGMDRENAANRRLSGCREGTPVDRTRTSVTNGLRKKLKDLMLDFQALRQRMMAEYRETVERRYFTVTGRLPEEEAIERIIANGEEEEILRAAMEEHGRGRVEETVREIQGRHDAAREIEKSLLELHQVFLDMAVMVEAQGEQMDDIEHHVSRAAEYASGGAKELAAAAELRRRRRKWVFLGLILLLLLILVVVVPVAASLN